MEQATKQNSLVDSSLIANEKATVLLQEPLPAGVMARTRAE